MLQIFGITTGYLGSFTCYSPIGYNITTNTTQLTIEYSTYNLAEGQIKLSYSTIGYDYKGNID